MLGVAPLSGAAISALSGAPPPYVPPPPAPGSYTPDPDYDLLAVYDVDAQGYCWSRGDYDAMWGAWAGNRFQPLSQTQVLTAIASVDGPQPPPVTSIRQLPGYDDAPLYFATWASQPGTIGGP